MFLSRLQFTQLKAPLVTFGGPNRVGWRIENSSIFNPKSIKNMKQPSSLQQNGADLVEQLLHKIMQRFRGGLVFNAHRLLYHSTVGLREKKKKKKISSFFFETVLFLEGCEAERDSPPERTGLATFFLLLWSLEMSDTAIYEP